MTMWYKSWGSEGRKMGARGGYTEITLDRVTTEVSEVVLNLELGMNKPGKYLKEEHSRQTLQMMWIGLLYSRNTTGSPSSWTCFSFTSFYFDYTVTGEHILYDAILLNLVRFALWLRISYHGIWSVSAWKESVFYFCCVECSIKPDGGWC